MRSLLPWILWIAGIGLTIITPAEEALYFAAAKSEGMNRHADPALLHDVAAILLDCGLRPEECFRLKWQNVRDGVIEIEYGKADNARRRIPMSERVATVIEMRRSTATGDWVFPAGTRSGHVEPSSVKKAHRRACQGDAEYGEWTVAPFPLYTLRHTCLTRWAPHMDPWTLHRLAGHRDMSTTKRYIHPQDSTIREAAEKARMANSGHTSRHTARVCENDGATTSPLVN